MSRFEAIPLSFSRRSKKQGLAHQDALGKSHVQIHALSIHCGGVVLEKKPSGDQATYLGNPGTTASSVPCNTRYPVPPHGAVILITSLLGAGASKQARHKG